MRCCVQVVFCMLVFNPLRHFAANMYVWMYNGDWCPLVALYMRDFLIHLDILQPNTCLVPCNFWTDSCILGCGALTWRWRLIKYWWVRWSNVVGCYSSTTLYCKVLLQYYSSTSAVLQSTAPVLLQYYKILQRSTPVLLCTTKYYNVLLQYYKVLLQYCSVLTALQLEEPGAAISQGEVFLTVDLGCPSFEYLWPRSLPRSYLVPDLVHFPFNKQRFPSNLHWIWSFGWKIEIYASNVRPIVFCNFLLINPRCFWTFFNHASPCCFELINW